MISFLTRRMIRVQTKILSHLTIIIMIMMSLSRRNNYKSRVSITKILNQSQKYSKRITGCRKDSKGKRQLNVSIGFPKLATCTPSIVSRLFSEWRRKSKQMITISCAPKMKLTVAKFKKQPKPSSDLNELNLSSRRPIGITYCPS